MSAPRWPDADEVWRIRSAAEADTLARMKRWVLVVTLVALVAAACSGQERPEVAPLPELPEEIVPDAVFAPDPATVFPNDGTCVVATGTGAQVSEILDGFPAEEVFQVGDVVVSADGAAIASAEELIAMLQGRAPGETVAVDFHRGGEAMTADVTLAPSASDPERGLLGIVPITPYDVHEPAAAPAPDMIGPNARPAFIGDDLYLLDPLGAEWQLYAPGVGQQPVVAFDGEVWALVAPEAAPDLVALRGGGLLEIDADDWRFSRPLTTIGDLVLLASFRSPLDDPTTVDVTAVVAVDTTTGQVVWTWDPGVSADGLFYFPAFGYRSPADSVVLITLTALDPAVEGPSGLTHVLLDGAGNELSRFGEDDRAFIPDDAVAGGFFDDTSIIYGGVVDGQLSVGLYSIPDGTAAQIASAEPPESGVFPRFLTVGDGRHILGVGEADVRLIDISRGVDGRPISQSCDMQVWDYGGLAT